MVENQLIELNDDCFQRFDINCAFAAHAFWFGEDQARYVVTVRAAVADKTIVRARAAAVPVRRLGSTGGDALTLAGERPILVAQLRESFEGWLPAYMVGGLP